MLLRNRQIEDSLSRITWQNVISCVLCETNKKGYIELCIWRDNTHGGSSAVFDSQAVCFGEHLKKGRL